MIRVSGPSMSGAGILDGDTLVVDSSLEARSGNVVIAGEMTVKRLRHLRDGSSVLRAEHPGYPEIVVREEQPAEIWGVVVGLVRKMV